MLQDLRGSDESHLGQEMAILPLAQIFLDVDLSWLKSDNAGNMVQHRGKKGIALSFEILDNYVGLPPWDV